MKNLTNRLARTAFSFLIAAGLSTSAVAQTTVNWIGPASGGEWNNGANWDSGSPPLDPTTNATIARGTNVSYNLPMLAASFGGLTNQGVLNINTNGFNCSAIAMCAAGGSDALFINSNGIVNVSGSLGFCSNAAVTLAVGGSLSVGGTLIIGSNPNGSTGSSTVGAFGSFTNNGGSLTAANTALNPNNQSIGTSCRLIINGGTNNLGTYKAQRSPGGANSPPALGTDGLVVSNGFVNATGMAVGNNAHGIIFVAGGIVTNTGNLVITNNTSTRPARFVQRGGVFVTVDPSEVVMAGTADSVYSVTGGTNIVGGIQFSGTTIFLTNSAQIYIGSAGITSNGSPTTINAFLNGGGKFGATTDWTNTEPINLNGGIIDAEDWTGTPHNIYSSGLFRGAGALIKTGGGTLTLASSNTYSGTTSIQNGTLALANDPSGSVGSVSSPTIIVGSGTTFDVSQVAYSVNAFQTLGGYGVVTGEVDVASNGIINSGSNTVSGILSFSNDVIETGGAVNHFDVPGDVLNIAGSFTVSGTNTMEIAGGLTPGVPYALVHYGSFSGDITTLLVTGATGTLSNSVTDQTIYLTIQSSLRANTNVTWVGNTVNNNWDTHNLTNWLDGGVGPLDFFLSGDNARFDDNGAANTNVNIPGSVSPASIVVDSTANYVFSGTGLIDGPSTTLTKTNSGTLTLLTTNTYAGATIFGGGALEVLMIANSTLPSPLGTATSDPSFLVFNGGTLRYSGDSASTDHGATFNTNAVFDVTNSATTLTLNGTLIGNGGLTKLGAGTLALTAPNTYVGATTLSNGVLTVNGSGTIGTAVINYASGTLNLASSSSQQFYANLNNIVSTGTIVQNGANGNLILSGAWTGAGTANIDIQNGGGTLTLNHDITTNFTGTIRLTDASTGTFRFNSGGNANGAQECTGSPMVTFDLGNGSAALINRNGGGTSNGNYYLGTLQGGASTSLKGSGNSGTLSVYNIGAKNLNTTFSGTIVNGSVGPTAIVKVGTGILTLTGQDSFGGFTAISNGVLALANIGNGDGTINGSTNIFINSGAILDLSGEDNDLMSLNSGQVLCGNGTVNGILDNTAGGTVTAGSGINGAIGTLTVTNYINLGGTAWMKLNRTSAQNSDRLVAPTNNFMSGTLVVTNTGPELHAGDTFTLFSGTLTGGFGTVILPNYYNWDTNQLTVNGTISVIAPNPPVLSTDFSALKPSGTITFNATNGIPNGPVQVLSTTNVALPITDWTVITNGNFDGSGNFSAPMTVDPTAPRLFFVISAQ